MIHQCKSPRAVADRIRRRSSRADRPRLEQLERRELLTAGGSVAPPTLYVSVLLPGANGTGASLVTFQEVAPGSSDTLSLSVDPTSGNFEYNWENNGYTTQLGLQYVNGSLVPIAFPPSEIEQISVTLGASSDVLTIDNSNGSVVPPGGLTLDGGPGSSSLVIEGNSSSNPITTQVVSLAPTTSGTSTITLNGAPITLSNFVNIADVTSSNTLNVVDLNTANDSLSLRDYNPATDAPLTDSSTPSSLVATTLVGSGPLFSFSNQPNVNITTGSGNDSISIDTTEQTTNLQSLNITAGGGNDSFSALSIPSGIAYVLDGGSGTSTFSGDFATFDGDLTLQNFQDVTQYSTLTPGIVFVTTGDFSGAVYSVNDPSATQEFTIGGSMLKGSSITAISIDQLLVTTEIDGDVTAVENLNIPGSGVIHTIKAYDQGADSSIDAGSIGAETFTQNMAGSTTAKGAGTIGTVTVGGDMSGTIYAPEDTNSGSGTVSSVNVTGSFTGSLNTGTLTEISVGSNLTGSVTAQGAGTIGTVTVGGDMSGTIYAPEDTNSGSGTVSSVNVTGSFTGSLNSGTITEVSVGSNLTGSVTAQGAGLLGKVTVGGYLSGELIANDLINGSLGAINQVIIGQSLDNTAQIVTVNLGSLEIGGDLAGSVKASQAIQSINVGGSTSGSIVTSLIENLNAPNAVGPVVFNVTIGGVPYSLVASQTQGASLSGVTFGYAITTPASGIPTLTVHVNNPDPSAIRFNLGVDSGSAAGTMDLALIDSTTGKDAGIDNLVVDGDLLAGGVNLPQDPMLGVAIRNDAAAGSVNALSVESVAFGSVTTTNGVTIPASQANVWTAYDLLAPGTGLAQANGNFVVDFGLNSPVAQFLVTTPFLGFDFRPILFSDPFSFNSNTNVTAQVDVTIPIFVSQVQSVSFAGSGGSIATSLPIWTSITSTGPLGNVVLSSPLGIVANVTAPSVVGNIEATAGPISSIIQTTSGDLGELITNASGVVIGTTLITADDGGISGEIISRGDLVSSIVSEGSISGVIAAQGDLGSIARDSSGNAIVDSTGSLTRYGTISTNGNFSGQIVALGNSFASIDVGGNWQGRMIVAGAPIAGLAAGREGILGSITINHNITGQGAIVSGGQIGDPTGDSPTSLSVENMNGIVAAIGSIAFGDLDRLNGSVFMNSTGANAAAIDAILATTSFDSPAGSFNLAGLESILDELADLKVKKGNLIV